MKSILTFFLFIFSLNFAVTVAEECAIMKGDEIDPEEFSEVLGKKVYFCCGTCVKAFDKATAYYVKAVPELGKLLQMPKRKNSESTR